MSKQNKIIFRIVAVMIMALLICLCFLGSTFARYTSTVEGEGKAYIASWSFTNDNSITFNTSQTLAPLKSAYYLKGKEYVNGVTTYYILNDDDTTSSYTSDNYSLDVVDSEGWGYILDSNGDKIEGTTYYEHSARVNTSGYVEVLKVTNSGNVTALLETDLTKNAVTFCDSLGGTVTFTNDGGGTGNITTANAKMMFTYNLYVYDSSTYTYYLLSDDSAAATACRVIEATETLSIYGMITWTSDISSTIFGSEADKLDTFIGENVSYLSFTSTCTAVQYATHPTDN